MCFVGQALDGMCVGMILTDPAGRVLGNQEIASELHVAVSTIRSHMKSVYRKTGLTSRSEAIRYAIENSLA